MTTPRRGFKMGRPTGLTPELAKKIAEMICDGVSPDIAARAAGIHRATLYDWRARGRQEGEGIFADFEEMIEQALAQCARTMTTVMIGS